MNVVHALLLVLLLPAAEVFAQAGGGSSGFGGGGGGGGSSGGGGFSGGGGSSGSGSSGEGSLLAVLIVFGLFALFFAWAGLMMLRARARRKLRVQRVTRASAEAAEDDPAFAADAVLPAARELFLDAQRAWDERDHRRLAQLIGEDLFTEWDLRLKDFENKGWHNRVRVVDGPEIEYVGLTNRAADEEDRAVVRIKALLDSYVMTESGSRIEKTGSSGGHSQIVEYWTLAKRDGRWILMSIEPGAEGDHHLSAPIVATPWSDNERLYGESVTELAVTDAAPPGFDPGELVDVDLADNARAQALDLFVADGRFAPAVLEAAAQRAVAAWAEAVDGEDAPLEAVASPEAIRELLYGYDDSGRTRLVVRGPRIRRIAILDLDAAADPPAMTLEVDVSGRRYMENRDTLALLAGSRDSDTTFAERWTLTLSGPPDAPWQLAAAHGAGSPAA